MSILQNNFQDVVINRLMKMLRLILLKTYFFYTNKNGGDLKNSMCCDQGYDEI